MEGLWQIMATYDRDLEILPGSKKMGFKIRRYLAKIRDGGRT